MSNNKVFSRRNFLATSVAALSLTVLAACGEDKPKDDSTPAADTKSALEKNEIIVGYDNTFVPMGFDENGETKGFDVDVAALVGKKLGKTFKFKNIDWSLKEAELNSGKIDAIWNGYSITDERRKKVAPSDPYMNNDQIILVKADSPIKTKADLAGKKLASQTASAGSERVAQDPEFQKSLAGGAPVFYDTFDKALRDLEVGRNDAVVGDSVLLNYYAKQKGSEKFRVLDENLGTEQFVVAVRKNDPKFLEAINKSLKELQDSGDIDKLKAKWFN